MNLNEYGDMDLMVVAVANALAGELRQILSQQERATFVVSGGSTPGPVYDVLCEADLDWSRVDIIPSDERWVPEVHVRSNARMIRERLLKGRAKAAVFHSIYAKAEHPDNILPIVAEKIAPLLPISVALLGMGADMHTASIFPNSDNTVIALKKRGSPVLVSMEVLDQPDIRVTLSARVLNNAMFKHVLISGRAKRNAIENAQGKKKTKAPIKAVLGGATVHWTL